MNSNKDKIILIKNTFKKDRNVLFSSKKESYLVSLSLIVASSAMSTEAGRLWSLVCASIRKLKNILA